MTEHQTIDQTTNYFSTINSLAQKIHLDIDATRLAYDHVWNELNICERNDVINESLINPELELRYFDRKFPTTQTTNTTSSMDSSNLWSSPDIGDEDILLELSFSSKSEYRKHHTPLLSSSSNVYAFDGENLRTFIAQKTAQKIIQDDTIGLFRDEHSGPFSFRTPSQMNLNFSESNDPRQMAPSEIVKTAKNRSAGAKMSLLKSLSKASDAPEDSNSAGMQHSLHHKPEKMEAANSGLIPTVIKTAKAKYERFYDDVKAKSVQESTRTAAAATGKLAPIADDRDNNVNFGVGRDDDDDRLNFFTKFICKNNLIFNAPNSVDRNLSDGGVTTNIEAAEILSGGSSIAEKHSLQSEEDDDSKHAYEESRLLLDTSADDLRKNFDFLNNW